MMKTFLFLFFGLAAAHDVPVPAWKLERVRDLSRSMSTNNVGTTLLLNALQIADFNAVPSFKAEQLEFPGARILIQRAADIGEELKITLAEADFSDEDLIIQEIERAGSEFYEAAEEMVSQDEGLSRMKRFTGLEVVVVGIVAGAVTCISTAIFTGSSCVSVRDINVNLPG
ncbi:Oidioi.mRNA.OKI2018_I69.chr1.g1167.t1.cds [Oikopleura dioica]|uniref:Oidioi.mRNA.OKI2018_I69.chr1.g1167.t1.cds n=1 Tax=Oikopleura dioica TaxID=34765 RepID=A0ABN7SSA6_OIKDI|nr:Oidioi.mRNA.OKI2018_I69.chr1.g1167.t1.cds [Oikopleura dioica]